MSRPLHGGNLRWAADIAGCSPSCILDFSASINPLGPPKSAITAIQTHLDTLTAYPDPSYQSICQVLSEVHRLPIDWFLPGNGSAELLTWACRDLAQLAWTGVLTPAFADYQRALKAFQAQIRPLPVDLSQIHQQSSSDLIEQALQFASQSADSAQAGLLLNNPHNPTGGLISISQIEPFLEQFSLVVVDEAFIDFLPENAHYSLISKVQDFPNLIVLRSLTKFYSLPGLRLGYAVGHPDQLQRWQQCRDPWSVNSLAVMAGIAVLGDQAFQNKTLAWLPPVRAELMQGLVDLGAYPLEGAANFLLVQTKVSVPLLQELLLKHHRILIRDCLSFPELGDHYFRIAVRTQAENQRLLTALADCLPRLSV